MTVVGYFVSGHGYGHATRSFPMFQELKKKGNSVFIFTPHPFRIFPEEFQADLVRLDSSCDGVIQLDGITIDVEATRARLAKEAFCNVEHLKELIVKHAIQLVVSDVSFNVAEACRILDLPCVLLSNFLWDSIYTGLGIECGKVTEAYSRCTWIRMAGLTESPAFPATRTATGSVIDVPPIYRKPSGRSKEAILREFLAVHKTTAISLAQLLDSRLLLVTFGGHGFRAFETSDLVPLTDVKKWIVLATGALDQITNEGTHIIGVNGDLIYYPDLTECCDVVLGKLGYGTLGDVIGSGTPMIYVERRGFVEEAGLLDMMRDYGTGPLLEMSKNDFDAGRWSRSISEITARECKPVQPVESAEVLVVDILDSLIKS